MVKAYSARTIQMPTITYSHGPSTLDELISTLLITLLPESSLFDLTSTTIPEWLKKLENVPKLLIPPETPDIPATVFTENGETTRIK
jgi:hypothetical protein